MIESSETERYFEQHPFKLTIKSDNRIHLFTSPFDLSFGDQHPSAKQMIGMAILFLQEVHNKL